MTGSGRLDLYQRRGDSLAGRYTQFHLFPFTLGELCWDPALPVDIPARLSELPSRAGVEAEELWTDRGDGEFGLFYLRTKEKHEVDFLVTRDGRPLFMVEA